MKAIRITFWAAVMLAALWFVVKAECVDWISVGNEHGRPLVVLRVEEAPKGASVEIWAAGETVSLSPAQLAELVPAIKSLRRSK